MSNPTIHSQDPILEAVMSIARSRPQGVALRILGDDTSREVRYGDLEAAVTARAKILVAAGLRPGDRVVVAGKNGPEWIMSHLALACAGATVTPLDMKLT